MAAVVIDPAVLMFSGERTAGLVKFSARPSPDRYPTLMARTYRRHPPILPSPPVGGSARPSYGTDGDALERLRLVATTPRPLRSPV